MLERLGVLTSYSRPRVSDDNPDVESHFGTMKTRVGYPDGALRDTCGSAGTLGQLRALVQRGTPAQRPKLGDTNSSPQG